MPVLKPFTLAREATWFAFWNMMMNGPSSVTFFCIAAYSALRFSVSTSFAAASVSLVSSGMNQWVRQASGLIFGVSLSSSLCAKVSALLCGSK